MRRRPAASARGTRLRTAVAAALLAAVPLAACVAPDEAAPAGWPPPPDDRPVVELDFAVGDDLTQVTGRERLEVVADRRLCELVFRTWPNKARTARAGNSLVVTAAEVDGAGVTPRVEAAGAPEGHPGTLVTLDLPRCVEPGAEVTAVLDFALTLGPGTDERVGTSVDGDVAWWGSGFPLLAWVRDGDWGTAPAVDVPGESAVSEVFDLRALRVTAPDEHTVLGAGTPVAREELDAGTARHTFTAPAVRDVTVTVGRLGLVEHETDGVRYHLGVPEPSAASAEAWLEHLESAADGLSRRFGPVPYADVWVSVLPGVSEGVEYPGALQLGDVRLPEESWLVTHELAHLWFYGLVGNDQARDPWLDEAFATYAQQVADGEAPSWHEYHGLMGQPMAFWEQFQRPGAAYIWEVYQGGADALWRAREAAGPEAFDAAVRTYLTDNAHEVADPADVRAAFADVPEAVEVLREAGAFDG